MNTVSSLLPQQVYVTWIKSFWPDKYVTNLMLTGLNVQHCKEIVWPGC